MNNLKVFSNAEFGQIRTVTMGDEPYFVGKDVAGILGYQNGSRDINRHVDGDDKTKLMVFDGIQNKETIVINESGQWLLYKDYSKCGYTHSETIDITHSDGSTSVKMNTKWTQKVRE
ncbi:Phage antirepressor protein KilAC domain-containing protein [Lacrimispora sphenoides]|uniref:BRO family protein n=1 Tax=Lacrimispora sphenoides TaxID=29370 RepID=UPI0008AD05ED|nr:BRO family protein [Lacrimispora sphenoides]SET72057.1 Phage antirepressor protein KilAC domain-containing protein [Lacrimispora sphenoides]